MNIVRTIFLSLIVLLLIAALAALIILPAIIAFRRRLGHKWAIVALTIMGFWLMLPWIGALIWSLSAPRGSLTTDDSDSGPHLAHVRSENEEHVVASGNGTPGVALFTGIVLLPLIFSWFTLREGYSKTTRILSLSYAGIYLAAVAGGVYAASAFVDDMRNEAVQARGDAEIAVRNRQYMVTTVDQVAAAIRAGQEDRYRQHVIRMEGTVDSMRPRAGHTEIALRGDGGAVLMLHGDYQVGLKPGDEADAYCLSIAHIGPAVRLMKCAVAPLGTLPLPRNARIVNETGSTSGKAEADALGPEQAAPQSSDRTEVFGGGARNTPGAEAGDLVDNPFDS